MGFDKPDLGFVVHYQRPSSPIAYYQQVGRAGRAVENAYGILLSGREDDAIAEYFMSTAFPPAARMRDILAALEATDSATIKSLQASVNLPYGQIEKALKLLEVDGAVDPRAGPVHAHRGALGAGRGLGRGGPRGAPPRAGDDAGLRRHRPSAGWRSWAGCSTTRRPATCGHCANDGGVRWPRTVSPPLVQAAVAFLRRDVRGIDPRRQWPEGGQDREAQRDRAGAVHPGRPGVGEGRGPGDRRRSRAGRAGSRTTSPGAAQEVIRGRWRPNPMPEWVTAVPSATRPGSVEAFAQRLATVLGLPFAACLTSARRRAPGARWPTARPRPRTRAPSWASGPPPSGPGPVLLVDDLVDSRWTLTVAGSLLRDAGAGPVFPFALAVATPRGE